MAEALEVEHGIKSVAVGTRRDRRSKTEEPTLVEG
jgi:hypothetical protein